MKFAMPMKMPMKMKMTMPKKVKLPKVNIARKVGWLCAAVFVITLGIVIGFAIAVFLGGPAK